MFHLEHCTRRIWFVVDAGCSHVGVVRQAGRLFECAAGGEESLTAGCSADMISNPVGEPRVEQALRPAGVKCPCA